MVFSQKYVNTTCLQVLLCWEFYCQFNCWYLVICFFFPFFSLCLRGYSFNPMYVRFGFIFIYPALSSLCFPHLSHIFHKFWNISTISLFSPPRTWIRSMLDFSFYIPCLFIFSISLILLHSRIWTQFCFPAHQFFSYFLFTVVAVHWIFILIVFLPLEDLFCSYSNLPLLFL